MSRNLDYSPPDWKPNILKNTWYITNRNLIKTSTVKECMALIFHMYSYKLLSQIKPANIHSYICNYTFYSFANYKIQSSVATYSSKVNFHKTASLPYLYSNTASSWDLYHTQLPLTWSTTKITKCIFLCNISPFFSIIFP